MTVPAKVVEILAEHAAEHDRAGTYPAEGVAAVHEAGLLTATVGAEYGGPGAGLADTVAMLAELGRGDPSVALITAMTLFVHASQARRHDWPADVYREVLAGDGPVLLNYLRVEPELGTPARGGLPATTARRTADGWSLSGRKIYSTGAEGLRWMLVWARTDDEEPLVGNVIVRADAPGIAIEPTWDHLGLRASVSHDVILTDVPVPAGSVLPLAPPGVAGLDAVQLAWNNLGLAALYLGVARSARGWLVRFLHERVPSGLGRPLATLPRFHTAVGEIEAHLVSAEEVLTALARRVDAGDPDALARTGMGKLLATRASIAAVEHAVALVGNPALTRHNPLERHLRDVLCARVHMPQDDVVLAGAGRSVLEAGAP